MKDCLLLFSFLIHSSFTPILKAVTGVSNPKIESNLKINEYANKLKIDENYIFQSISDLALINNKYLKGIPDAIVLNQNNQIIKYQKDSLNCNFQTL